MVSPIKCQSEIFHRRTNMTTIPIILLTVLSSLISLQPVWTLPISSNPEELDDLSTMEVFVVIVKLLSKFSFKKPLS